MSKQNLQTLLQRVGQTVGIADLALDEDDYCQLRIDGTLDITIEFKERDEQAVFTARCGTLAEHNRTALLQEIADANFYWIGGGGGTLSTHSKEGLVYLQFRESTTQMDQTRLESLLEALVTNAEYWAGRLSAAPADTTVPSDTAATANLIPNRA